MVPRLHARGTSFKGASAYLFHDKNRAQTSDRVAWSECVNCWSSRPEDAWFEMADTWKERHALKRAAGVNAGGRDNKAPVLHFSLSWHPDERPTEERMKTAAREALQVMGLSDHQAVILSHNDEPHPHVHVLVNTVHRFTGETAKLKFSKEVLSRWAENLERADGQIRCDERVKNNERRRNIKQERQAEKTRENFNEAARKPYEPVKHRAPTRRQWFDRQEIIDRMKALRSDQKAEHTQERGHLWQEQLRAREALEGAAKKRTDQSRGLIEADFRPVWKSLYRSQKQEQRELSRADHVFERAAFVFKRRNRLSLKGETLSLRDSVRLILSPRALEKRLGLVHEKERKGLAGVVKDKQREAAERAWSYHRMQLNSLKLRQADERAALRSHHQAERDEVTFARAKEELIREADTPKAQPGFAEAASPPPPQGPDKDNERFLRDLEEWRSRGGHNGPGRRR